MASNKKLLQAEEYRSLRNEIDGYQRDGVSILEMGLVLSAALFAVATSAYVDDSWRWLVFLAPWIILFPVILLMTQRVRQTWIIGRYIEVHLEAKLGLGWEKFQFSMKTRPKRWYERLIPPFIWLSAFPLMVIQGLSIAVSLYAFDRSGVQSSIWDITVNGVTYNGQWKHLILILAVITFVIEGFLIRRANRPDKYAKFNTEGKSLLADKDEDEKGDILEQTETA